MDADTNRPSPLGGEPASDKPSVNFVVLRLQPALLGPHIPQQDPEVDVADQERAEPDVGEGQGDEHDVSL